MAIETTVGIDFGTSIFIVRVKCMVTVSPKARMS